MVISCKSDLALITIYHICYGKNCKFFCCNLVDSSILKFISSFSHTKWLWLLLTEHGKEIDSGLNFVVWTCTRGREMATGLKFIGAGSAFCGKTPSATTEHDYSFCWASEQDVSHECCYL